MTQSPTPPEGEGFPKIPSGNKTTGILTALGTILVLVLRRVFLNR